MLICPAITYGYTLMFEMDDEIINAGKIGEVIIRDLSYRPTSNQPGRIDTIVDNITFSFTNKIDSVVIYKTKRPAYWPMEIGDTVLIFLDSINEITLLAEIENNAEYRFWVPYHQWRLNTIIYCVNPPFRPDAENQRGSKQFYDAIHEKANSRGYEFGYLDHCRIEKEEFWTYAEKIITAPYKK